MVSGGFVKYWGQEASIHKEGNQETWFTTIGKIHYEKGQPASVGLNERFLTEAVKRDATLAVHITSVKRTIYVLASEFKKESWIHKHPSVIKPGTTFNIYMHPVKRYFL